MCLYVSLCLRMCLCVCGGESLWLVRLAPSILSPPSPYSLLKMTVIMHMPQQLQVQPTHFAHSSEGRKLAATLKADKPPFNCQSSDKEFGLSKGLEGRKGSGGKCCMNRGGACKASSSQGKWSSVWKRWLGLWGAAAET